MAFRKDEVGSRVWTFNFIVTEFFDHVEKLGHTTLIKKNIKLSLHFEMCRKTLH